MTFLLLLLALACATVARADDNPGPAVPLPEPVPTPAPAPAASRAPALLPPKPAPPLPLGARAVRFARHLTGIPYRWGGSSPRTGFDCSGFVRFVYGHFGISLPHSSYAQIGLGHRVPRRALRPGDLVFFDGAGHVGIYVGKGAFIHAPHTGTRVQISSLSGSYARGFDGARRLA
jgi:cell wall-associated NlpC family hydrolase